MFGSRLPLAERYVDVLAGPGITRGLMGPREVPRLWERHLLNCAAVREVIPEGSAVGDVGSGAGLPGLVLALCRPDLSVELIEPLLRRATFLSEVVRQLDLQNVEVTRSRAEHLHGTRAFDVVTARAVADLVTLAGWCVPLVRSGGLLVAMKGQSAASELEEARDVLSELGAVKPEVLHIEQPGVAFPTTVIRAEIRAPRPLSLPSKRRRARRPRGSDI